MNATKAYDEIVEFIAKGSTTKDVSDFRASESTKARVAELISRSKIQPLTTEEDEELKGYMVLEEIMQLAKARAKVRLKSERQA